jgi:hypothetical protein
MDLAIKITAKLKANPCVQTPMEALPAHAVAKYLQSGMNLRPTIGKPSYKMYKPAFVFDGRNILDADALELPLVFKLEE